MQLDSAVRIRIGRKTVWNLNCASCKTSPLRLDDASFVYLQLPSRYNYGWLMHGTLFSDDVRVVRKLKFEPEVWASAHE
jgi:hypothetical protein